MAILPQTVDDLSVLRPLLSLFDKIYGTVANADQRSFMVDNGLIAAFGKTIVRFFQKYGSTQPDVVSTGLARFCITIASISLRGSAPINVSPQFIRINCLLFHIILLYYRFCGI